MILHLDMHSAPSQLPVSRHVIVVVFGSKPGLQVTPAVELKKLSSDISSINSPFSNDVRLPQSIKKRLYMDVQKKPYI